MLLSTEILLANRYLIIRHIGYSGTAILYDAKDQVTKQRVILKQNRITQTSRQNNFDRGKRFIRSSAQDRFVKGQAEFTVIRDPLSDDLETLLQRQNGPFSIEQVIECANQLRCTLEHLHTLSTPVIHRHITPSTLKLSPQNEIILLHRPTTYPPNNIKRDLQGKLNPYASPEQFNDFKIDHSSDLYSLGATFFYLLTCKRPPTSLVRMYAWAHRLPDPLHPFDQVDPRLPFEVAHLLTTSLHLSPIERPSSARAMRNTLNRVGSKIQDPVMEKPRLKKSALLPNQLFRHKRRRIWLKPANVFLAICLLLLMVTVINISTPFTVHGDTLPPTTIRLTIPTPEVQSTPPTAIQVEFK